MKADALAKKDDGVGPATLVSFEVLMTHPAGNPTTTIHDLGQGEHAVTPRSAEKEPSVQRRQDVALESTGEKLPGLHVTQPLLGTKCCPASHVPGKHEMWSVHARRFLAVMLIKGRDGERVMNSVFISAVIRMP